MSEQQGRKTFRLRLEQMISVLRGEILTGKRLPGQFLPSERELVRQFQLSNKLIRAGLEQLVSEGLIVKIPRVGNKIADTIEASTVAIRFGYHSSLEREAAIDFLLTEFHNAHPTIRVQPIPIPFQNYYETVKEYMEAGMLDIVTMNYNNFDDFRTNRSLELLKDFDTDPGVYEMLSRAFTDEDRLLVRPFLFSPLILCYNRDHLREKGLPEHFNPGSWDELLRQASRLTVENKRFGFYFFLLSKNRWPVFFIQNGAKLRDGREEAAEAVKRMIEAISLCRDIIYASDTFPTFLSGSDAEAEELFLQGKVSVIMTSYFALNALRDSGIPFDIAPLPGIKNKHTILMTIGLAVNKKSKVIVAAETLANFFTSERAQTIIRQKTLSIPALRKAAQWSGEEAVYHPPNYPVFQELLPGCRLFTDLNMTSEELDSILKEARMHWSRLQTIESLRERILEIVYSRNQ
ncbi:extracellular solute-binding protein [Paenibacillus allorhizosphaerae]|uniref:HTH gntR-type domain-containing protein n=1 Tax=Paenibacillus allorhizosphaerae TaxID=2849866 RepID=A0ABM8VP13_9BACL|nr:extracellular solute-binding protein [Paenibacillus allorhizosphaerae]CAG7652300.1 hypothetical protein PAECIP111802_05188 [Paenibacillus allorhizosphaerae]